jgi:long-chain acyl-CoA synthetase
MLNPEGAKQAATPEGRAELEASMAAHLQSVNGALDPHEQLDCVVLMSDPWTVENDIITPTFKVKRNRIEDLFAKNYDKWVGARKKVVWYSA